MLATGSHALGEGDDLGFCAGWAMPWPARMTGLSADCLMSSMAWSMALRFGAEHGVGAVGRGGGGVEVKGGGGLLGVFGDVDEDGAGAAGAGDLEGLADGGGDVFGAGDEVVVLGDGEGDAGDVDFLECVGAEDFGGDLSGDGDDGDAVEHGRGDAGDEVGCAGAGGGHADSDLAGGAGVAVGHVGGALLVAHEDVVDGEFAQRVVDGEDGSAGVAEDGGGAFADEGGPEDFGAG